MRKVLGFCIHQALHDVRFRAHDGRTGQRGTTMKQSSEDNSHGLTPPPAPEDAGALAASEAHAVPAPPAPQQAPAQVAPADQFADVPTPPAPRRVHHQRYRVLELPAAQNHQEPRAFPQRRSRRQTLVARHLQHRRQKSRPAPHRRWQTPPTNEQDTPASSKDTPPPTGNKPSPNSPPPTPTESPPTSNPHTQKN